LLKGLDPLLHAELLATLRAMGHGDEIVVCDANFPARATAASTVTGREILLAGVGAPRAARAILSVLPLDRFVDRPLTIMAQGDPTSDLPAVQKEIMEEVAAAEKRAVAGAFIDRSAFHHRARSAYAVVATGERRLYGCFILKKGIVETEETA